MASTPPSCSSDAKRPSSGAAAAAETASEATKLKDAATAKYKEKDYAAAVKLYSEAILLTPTTQLYTNRAAAHMMLEQYEEARADCATAIGLDNSNIKAYLRGAKAELLMGRIAEALALATTATLKDPFDTDARLERQTIDTARRQLSTATEALNSREFDKALSLLNLLVDKCPASLEIRLKRIEAQLGLRKYEEAGAAATDLMSKHGSTDPRLLVMKARVMAQLGNSGGATKYLQEALRQDPDFGPASKILKHIRKTEALKATGNDAFKSGQWAAADKAYTECLEIDPNDEYPLFNAKLFANRAATRLKLSKNDAAFYDSSRAIELDPTFVNGYKRRGQAGVALGDKESLETAVRDWTKAKDLLAKEGNSDAEVERALRESKTLLKAAKKKDYYKILEIDKTADEEDIKKAYRKSALKWHPDRHSASDEKATREAEAMFKDVGEAYSILSDPTKRRQYDAGASFDGSGDAEPDEDHRGHSHGFGGGGFGGGGFGGQGGMPGGIPVEFLEHLFGGAGGMRFAQQGGPRPGRR